MAYTYKKLSEVELVETTATAPNLLIEDEGDIKKISARNFVVPQVKADWEENDPNSPAFILNKPEISGGGNGGGANVVTYIVDSGRLRLQEDGVFTTAQAVVDEWYNGSILRINSPGGYNNGFGSSVVNVYYTLASGVISSATVYYHSSAGIESVNV